MGRAAAAARALSLAAVVALAGCASVEVTPAAVERAARVPADERADLLRRWREALELANAFLDSPQRETLPAGRFELDRRRGMRFATAEASYPLRVRFTMWGDWVVAVGSVAQERSDGFVVGRSRSDPRDVAVDNSMFYDHRGRPREPAMLARLILHETAHVVLGVGTVGTCSSLWYYAEVALAWRTHNEHSAERLPRQVDRELDAYLAAGGR